MVSQVTPLHRELKAYRLFPFNETILTYSKCDLLCCDGRGGNSRGDFLLGWEYLNIVMIKGNCYHFSYSIIQNSGTRPSQPKSGMKSISLIWYLAWFIIALFTWEGLLGPCCLNSFKIHFSLFGGLEAVSFSNHRKVWISVFLLFPFCFPCTLASSFPSLPFASLCPQMKLVVLNTLLTFCFPICIPRATNSLGVCPSSQLRSDGDFTII